MRCERGRSKIAGSVRDEQVVEYRLLSPFTFCIVTDAVVKTDIECCQCRITTTMVWVSNTDAKASGTISVFITQVRASAPRQAGIDMHLYFYGNCQMPVLGEMLLEQHPCHTVTSCNISEFSATITREEVGQHLRNVEAADVVISQPISEFRGEPELSLQTLRDAMPSRSTLVTMPSIVFEGTHGAYTYLTGRFDGFHMPYHNSHTVEMALRGYDWQDIALLQASPDFYTAAFVEAGMEASLGTLRGREAVHDTTIKVSPLLEELSRSSVVMHTINHPGRPLMVCVLNQLYAALSIHGAAQEEGPDRLRYPHIPPLPSVLHHLRIAVDTPHMQTAVQSWTREEYLSDSLMFYGRLVRSDLIQALASSRGADFLASFHRGHKPQFEAANGQVVNLPEEAIAALVVDGFGALLERTPAPAEIKSHYDAIRGAGVRRWLEMLTSSREFTRRFGKPLTG